jgi:hypothetical protein
VRQHGLTEDEYARFVGLIGREPTITDAGEPVADVDDAGILARALDHPRRRDRQLLQVQPTPDLVRQHGLTEDEYARFVGLIGREPTITELGIVILNTQASPSPMSMTPAFSPGPWITHGAETGSFFRDEYARFVGLIGREPTITELGIVSAMWNEHCSYK